MACGPVIIHIPAQTYPTDQQTDTQVHSSSSLYPRERVHLLDPLYFHLPLPYPALQSYFLEHSLPLHAMTRSIFQSVLRIARDKFRRDPNDEKYVPNLTIALL